jgi:hypothetical protein
VNPVNINYFDNAIWTTIKYSENLTARNLIDPSCGLIDIENGVLFLRTIYSIKGEVHNHTTL